MELLKRFKTLFGPREHKRAVSYQTGLDCGLVTAPTRSGVTVTPETALSLSVLYRGARVISEAVGGLPLKLYRRTEDGREEAKDHPLWPVLTREPNPEMGEVEFKTLVQFWALIYGNGYAEIERNNRGEVLALWPVHPTSIRPARDELGNLVYEVLGTGGFLPAEDVLHLKGPSNDGSVGFSLVQLARESLGLTMAMERHTASFFGNSARPGGALVTAGVLSDQARANLRDSWNRLHQGTDKAFSVAVLEEGLDFKPFQFSHEEAQLTDLRNAQIGELCRWIGVDPIFVFEYGRATWNNSEAQTRNFLQFSLNPWLLKWESEVHRKCLLPSERDEFYPEFTREAIVQMDTLTQAQVYETGVRNGWLEPNEVRKWMNLPPLPEKKPEAMMNTPTPTETDGTPITVQ